jgi:hypothetical protein
MIHVPSLESQDPSITSEEAARPAVPCPTCGHSLALAVSRARITGPPPEPWYCAALLRYAALGECAGVFIAVLGFGAAAVFIPSRFADDPALCGLLVALALFVCGGVYVAARAWSAFLALAVDMARNLRGARPHPPAGP